MKSCLKGKKKKNNEGRSLESLKIKGETFSLFEEEKKITTQSYREGDQAYLRVKNGKKNPRGRVRWSKGGAGVGDGGDFTKGRQRSTHLLKGSYGEERSSR